MFSPRSPLKPVPRLCDLLDPRPSVADCGGALPAHQQRHVVRKPLTKNVKRKEASRGTFCWLLFGQNLHLQGGKWIFLWQKPWYFSSLQEYLSFLCRLSWYIMIYGCYYQPRKIYRKKHLSKAPGGLDNGKSLSYLRGHGWQPASSVHQFCPFKWLILASAEVWPLQRRSWIPQPPDWIFPLARVLAPLFCGISISLLILVEILDF